MALTKKINEFKKCFDIEDINIDENIKFVIDSKNNLYALFNKKRYILTNQRNTNKFLSHDTMKFKKSYGVEFLRAVGIEKTKTEPRYQKIYMASQEKAFGISKCKAPLIRVFKHENFIHNKIILDDCTDIDEKGNLVLNKKVSEIINVSLSKFPIVLCSSFGIPVNISYTYGMSELGLKLIKYLSCYTTDYIEIKMQKYRDEKEEEMHFRDKHTKIVSLCKDCIVEIKTKEEELYENLEVQEFKITRKKTLWDDSPYSERDYNILRKYERMKNDREDREEIRALEFSEYQGRKEYLNDCRNNGYELPDYAQYF